MKQWIKEKVITGLLAIPLILYLLHFFFFWLFESTDSYFYWAFANFLRTGQYSDQIVRFIRHDFTIHPLIYPAKVIQHVRKYKEIILGAAGISLIDFLPTFVISHPWNKDPYFIRN